jgi:Putative addiction module component
MGWRTWRRCAIIGYEKEDAMPETSIQTPPGFSDLSKAEKVRYLQSLWDQISEHPDEIPVPESHLLLAEARLRRYRESPSSAVPAFDVLDRLSQKSK